MSLPQSFIHIHQFPGGSIEVAVVYLRENYVVHAYRLGSVDKLRDDQWFAAKQGSEAEPARVLAYAKEKILGRQKTCNELWMEMKAYMEAYTTLD